MGTGWKMEESHKVQKNNILENLEKVLDLY